WSIVGVAEDDADALQRDAERGRDDLSRDRLRALPLLRDACLANHSSLPLQSHGDAALRRDARATGSVKCGTRVGDLDEARNAEPAMKVILAQCHLLGAKFVI